MNSFTIDAAFLYYNGLEIFMIWTIEWTDAGVVMLDQKRLPTEEIYHTYTDYEGVADAIGNTAYPSLSVQLITLLKGHERDEPRS